MRSVRRIANHFCAVAIGVSLVSSVLPASGAEAACISPLDNLEGIGGLLAEANGIGGTGVIGGDDGIGGTGLSAGSDGGIGTAANGNGLGGTGLTGTTGDRDAGTYEDLDNASLDRIRAAGKVSAGPRGTWRTIRGVITSLAGLCPTNSLVEIEGGAVVDDLGESLPFGALRVGQVVALDVVPAGASIYALQIALRPLIEGPVTAIDAAAGVLEVMGETVEVRSFVWIEDEASAVRLGLDEIKAGDSVLVHGTRAGDGRILATWLARRARSDIASVRGFAEHLNAPENEPGLRIGQVRIVAVAGSTPSPGRWVRAVGRWDAASATLADAQWLASEPGAASAAATPTPGEWSPDIRLHLGQWPPSSTR